MVQKSDQKKPNYHTLMETTFGRRTLTESFKVITIGLELFNLSSYVFFAQKWKQNEKRFYVGQKKNPRTWVTVAVCLPPLPLSSSSSSSSPWQPSVPLSLQASSLLCSTASVKHSICPGGACTCVSAHCIKSQHFPNSNMTLSLLWQSCTARIVTLIFQKLSIKRTLMLLPCSTWHLISRPLTWTWTRTSWRLIFSHSHIHLPATQNTQHTKYVSITIVSSKLCFLGHKPQLLQEFCHSKYLTMLNFILKGGWGGGVIGSWTVRLIGQYCLLNEIETVVMSVGLNLLTNRLPYYINVIIRPICRFFIQILCLFTCLKSKFFTY